MVYIPTAIVMPCLITGNKEIDLSRQQYRKTWKNYNNPTIPLIVLMMNYEKEYDCFSGNSSIIVYRTDRKFPVQVARQILSLLTEQEGYENTIQIDDDFLVHPGFGKSLESELDFLYNRLNVTCGWFNSRKRLFFTRHCKTETILSHVHRIDDHTKVIQRGTRIWEGYKKNYGYSYNTKEGILAPASDYIKALSSLSSILPEETYNTYLFQGEDVLLLTYLALNYGVYVRKIDHIHHKQYSPNKHKINDSPYWREDLPDLIPSILARQENDRKKLLSDIKNAETFLTEIDKIENNRKHFSSSLKVL